MLPPDVNVSGHEFVVVEGNIRFGLDAVKGVGARRGRGDQGGARGGRPVRRRSGTSARGSTRRAVNKKAIEALIKCGALRLDRAPRARGCSTVLEQAQGAGAKAQQDAPSARARSSTSAADAARQRRRRGVRGLAPADPGRGVRPARAARGREGVARPVPLARTRSRRCAPRCARRSTARSAELGKLKDGEWVTVGGIDHRSPRRSAPEAASPMMFATLDDLEGTVEMLVFEKTLAEYEADARRRQGRARPRPRRPQGQGQDLPGRPVRRALPPERRAGREGQGGRRPEVHRPRAGQASLDGALLAGVLDQLKHVFECFPGESEVVLDIATADGARTLRLGPSYRVAPTPSLRAELVSILGASALQTAAPAVPQPEPQAAEVPQTARTGGPSARRRPAGAWTGRRTAPRARSHVGSETRTSPALACSATRAAMLTSTPRSRRRTLRGQPRWRPTRICGGGPRPRPRRAPPGRRGRRRSPLRVVEHRHDAVAQALDDLAAAATKTTSSTASPSCAAARAPPRRRRAAPRRRSRRGR